MRGHQPDIDGLAGGQRTFFPSQMQDRVDTVSATGKAYAEGGFVKNNHSAFEVYVSAPTAGNRFQQACPVQWRDWLPHSLQPVQGHGDKLMKE